MKSLRIVGGYLGEGGRAIYDKDFQIIIALCVLLNKASQTSSNMRHIHSFQLHRCSCSGSLPRQLIVGKSKML